MDKLTKEALITSHLLEYFNSLPPSHQKEYVRWINQAKKEDTQKKRIEKMIHMLAAKQG